jgi:hypothetical protein
MYYFSYMLNERFKGRPFMYLVLPANLVWVLGPGYGMYVSYQMIMTGTYDLVRT